VRAHFLRQLNGLPHTGQIFSGNGDDCRERIVRA